MELINPKHSFVKFGEIEIEPECCNGENRFCIPVAGENDTWFQFGIRGEDFTEGQAIWSAPIGGFQLLILKGIGNTPETVNANVLRNWTVNDGLQFSRFRSSQLETTFIWQNIFKNISAYVRNNECFELAVRATVGEATITKVSNCFLKIADDCYTSVLEYASDKDDLGFRYCNAEAAVNRVRLPFFFSEPQFPDEELLSKQSSGAIKALMSVTNKQYQARTDKMTERAHEKLKAALMHDHVKIEGDRYTGGFRKNGQYDIDWQGNNCMAPANFKAFVSPYLVKSNNCVECQEVDSSPCDAVISNPTFGYQTGIGWLVSWNLISGSPGKYQISTPAVAGGAAFDTTDTEFLYEWLPVGEHIISVKPLCFIEGQWYQGESKQVMITVEEAPECVPVEITGTAPDGQVGVPYHYEYSLTGSGPYSISGASTLPAGLTIGIVGDKAVIDGTPSEAGEGSAISFTISNCEGANTDLMEDNINVSDEEEPEPIYKFEVGVSVVVGDATIESVTVNGEMPYDIADGEFPLVAGSSISAVHESFSDAIDVVVGGTVVGTLTLTLNINGSPIQTIPVTAPGTYSFDPIAVSDTDLTSIILS